MLIIICYRGGGGGGCLLDEFIVYMMVGFIFKSGVDVYRLLEEIRYHAVQSRIYG